MKIKTELKLVAFSCLVLIAALAFFLFSRFKEAMHETRINSFTHKLNQGVAELNMLTNDYFLNRSERIIRQWHLKYNSLVRQSALLAERLTDAHEQEVLADINSHYANVGRIFPSVIVIEAEKPLLEFGQVKSRAATDLLIELRFLSQNISELDQLSNRKLLTFQARANATIILCLLVILALIWSVSFLFTKIVAAPIESLRKGVEIIGAGNLDYKIGIKRRDEIGQLSAAFNAMTSRLKDSLERLARINRNLMMVSECSQVLVRSTDEAGLLKEVCSVIVNVGGYGLAWIGYVDEPGEPAAQKIMASASGAVGLAQEAKEFSPARQEELRRMYGSAISLPLAVDFKNIGSLNIYAENKKAFTQDEAALLTEMTADITFGIATMRARQEQRNIQQALAENESLLRTLIESMPFDIFVINEKGRYILSNSTCRRNWGELLGRSPDEVTADEDTLALWRENNRRAFAGETVKGEVEMRIKGDKRFFYNVITPIIFAGRVTNIIGVNIDITERKKAELALQEARENLEIRVQKRTQELARLNVDLHDEVSEHRKTEENLKESEERFHRIINTITDYIYTVRVSDGRAVETVHLPACVAITGYSEQEFRADPYLWINIVYEEDRKKVMGWTEKILNGERMGTIEHRIVRKDGALRWLSDTPVFHFNKEGRLIAYNGVVQDITERKLAERQEAMAGVLASIIDKLPLAAIITDMRGNVAQINRAFSEEFGYGSEAIGGPFLNLTAEDYRGKAAGALSEVFEKGYLNEFSIMVIRKDKHEPARALLNAAVLTDGWGSPVSILMVFAGRKNNPL